MKYSRCDKSNICSESMNNINHNHNHKMTSNSNSTSTTTNNFSNNLKMTMSPVTSSGFLSDLSPTPSNNNGTQFSDEFRTVESLYEKWSDCERTVVLYALLKRLRYPCLKFLQYSIDNNLTQHAVSQSTMNAVIADINANNPSYLQNLYNAYNTFHLGDIVEAFSSTSSSSSSTSSCASDKESMPCYGSTDFQLKSNGDERKLYGKKEDILNEVLNILPLLKPGNEDAKTIYLSLIPEAVKDTIKQVVPPELVQQIFSYLLIHPAVTSDDRRSLSVWLRQLEDFFHCSQRAASSFFLPSKPEFHSSSNNSINAENLMVTSVCSASSSCSSSSVLSGNSVNANIALCGGSNSGNNGNGKGAGGNNNNNSLAVSTAQRNSDWQTIAPPAKFKHQYQLQHHQHQQQQQVQQQQQQQQQPKVSQLTDWCDALTRRRQSCGGISTSMTDQLCDNFNGITLNELGSSHSNSLGLSSLVGDSTTTASIDSKESSLVNGVVAAAASAEAAAAASQSSLFGGTVNSNINTNPIINIISNNNGEELVNEDHDTSFSKNGTDFDFEPPNSNSGCNNCSNSINQFASPKEPFGLTQPFSSLFVNGADQMDANRWSLDSKIAALKTRRSNSLTTQTISTSSSSNSSVVTVNDNCSNSTENLAQFANKPRSFSLSIENQQRGALINGGSDTRLDDFKPNYIKFQTRNVGMSNIGTWLKSLRLHKYVELFYNLTYEDMLHITEEYLQNLGVTKGASHKLALCIEKLKERPTMLAKLEQDLMSGKQQVNKAIEDLTSLVLTPMKPIESGDSVAADENVALLFLRAIELVCSIVQRDPYVLSEDESLNSIVWVLDRAIHSEAFISHINQLKELKFQISKLKVAFAPRLHYSKNGGGNTSLVNLNKTRWNNKPRKCDSKTGSNDRINYRKNSGDMLNFQSQQNGNDYTTQMTNGGGGNDNNSQFKNSSYSSYMNQQTQQQSQQQQQQQSQYQPHIAQQQNHFPSLPQPSNQANAQQKHHQTIQQSTTQHQQQNGRSFSNLILVSGGPQQVQKMVFKPSGHQQGVLSMTNSIRASADNLQTEKIMHHQQQQQQQQRKGSLASVLSHNTNANNNNNINNNNININSNKNTSLSTSSNVAFSSTANKVTKTQNNSNNDSTHQQHQQQQQQQQSQQPKKTMAAVVMVSNENLASQIDPNTTDNLSICQNQNQNQNQNQQHQQQQQQQQQNHSIVTDPTQLIINSGGDILGDDANLISQQQLQLLAAAAAVASCSNLQKENTIIPTATTRCICNSNFSSNRNSSSGGEHTHKNISLNPNNNGKTHSSHSNNNNNNNNDSLNSCSTCSNGCNDLLTTTTITPTTTTSPESNSLVDVAATFVVNRMLLGKNSILSYENGSSQNSTISKNIESSIATIGNNNANRMNDMKSLEQLETLCLQMTEQAIN